MGKKFFPKGLHKAEIGPQVTTVVSSLIDAGCYGGGMVKDLSAEHEHEQGLRTFFIYPYLSEYGAI